MVLVIACPDSGDKPWDWATASAAIPIPRRCPQCRRDSIRGHGWRCKQAHDADHDWIPIRRGRCAPCHISFTFLPPQSLPYTHYSVAARSQAIERCLVENRTWEQSAPELKSELRCPDLSTLRRWCRCLDTAPDFKHLRRALALLPRLLKQNLRLWHDRLPATAAAILQIYWQLRL